MTDADLVVIGAGIVGCMVARTMLSRAPGASVMVLDRQAIGCGASLRSAGLHIPRGRTNRVRGMASYSQRYYEKLMAGQPGLPIYPLEMLVVATDGPNHQADAHGGYLDECELRRGGGLPGWIDVPDGAAAWRGSGCQYADVPALARALAGQLRPAVSFREGVRVTAIEPGDAGVVVRVGTGETVTAGHVVLAPGPWLGAPAWRELVAPVRARVKKVVAMHLDLEVSAADRVIIFDDEDAFLLPLRDRGHWLFSYTCQEWDVAPDDLVDGLSRRNRDEAGQILARYAPSLAARFTGGRVFCDAYSGTGEPDVRVLDEAGRVVFAGAANGSGYRLAPAIAAAAADLVLSPFSSRSAQCLSVPSIPPISTTSSAST